MNSLCFCLATFQFISVRNPVTISLDLPEDIAVRNWNRWNDLLFTFKSTTADDHPTWVVMQCASTRYGADIAHTPVGLRKKDAFFLFFTNRLSGSVHGTLSQQISRARNLPLHRSTIFLFVLRGTLGRGCGQRSSTADISQHLGVAQEHLVLDMYHALIFGRL